MPLHATLGSARLGSLRHADPAAPRAAAAAVSWRTDPRGLAPDSLAANGFALVHGVGVAAMARIVWEVVVRRRRVLALIGEAPARLGLARRLLLSFTDGVLASTTAMGALERFGVAPSRLVTIGQAFDHSIFTDCSRTRDQADAHRIVFVGELSPHSGVADFQACATAWAERHPSRRLEIHWLGKGDLQGVLYAQLVPSNLVQVFAEIPPPGELATTFARCGLIVLPSIAHGGSTYLAEAMAAGLVVLGSTRNVAVRGLVTPGETGWLFDPLSPGQISMALDEALSAAPARLDVMRAAARARIENLYAERPDAQAGQTHQDAPLGMTGSGSPAQAWTG